MKNIDFNRIYLLVKRDLLSDRSSWIKPFIGVYVGLAVVMVFSLITTAYNIDYLDADAVYYTLENTSGIVLFLCIFFMVYFDSRTFSNFLTKGNRISYLTLPATNAEKFISRLIRSLVLFPVGIFAAMLLADLSQFILLSLLAHHVGFVTPHVFSDIAGSFHSVQHSHVTFGIFLVLTFFSLIFNYVLGSAIFRKMPFIMTTFAWWAVGSVIALMIGFSFNIFGAYLDQESVINWLSCLEEHSELFETCLKYGIMTLEFFWIIFCIWLSYRLFCKANVIPTKRFGL